MQRTHIIVSLYSLAYSLKVSDWLFLIIIFCYIIIVKFAVFHLFQFSNYLLFNKSISSFASSVQKKTAEVRKKTSYIQLK